MKQLCILNHSSSPEVCESVNLHPISHGAGPKASHLPLALCLISYKVFSFFLTFFYFFNFTPTLNK